MIERSKPLIPHLNQLSGASRQAASGSPSTPRRISQCRGCTVTLKNPPGHRRDQPKRTGRVFTPPSDAQDHRYQMDKVELRKIYLLRLLPLLQLQFSKPLGFTEQSYDSVPVSRLLSAPKPTVHGFDGLDRWSGAAASHSRCAVCTERHHTSTVMYILSLSA